MFRKLTYTFLGAMAFSLTIVFSQTPTAHSHTAPVCANWNTVQSALRQSPSRSPVELYMPPGFQNGCVFQVIWDLEETVYILRDGLSLAQIVTPGVSIHNHSADNIPWFKHDDINHALVTQLKAGGGILTYFQGCATAEGYALNCADRPWDSPYVVSPNMVCVQGSCLYSGNIDASQLLPLWGRVEEPRVENFWEIRDEARRNYEPIPWHLIPNYPEQYREIPEAIALHLYGRRQLGEGEWPSTVDPARYYDEGYVVMNLTNWGLADDAMGAIQYRLEFEPFDDGHLNLVWAGSRYYCKRVNYWTAQYGCP